MYRRYICVVVAEGSQAPDRALDQVLAAEFALTTCPAG
jgi:hypothetical protein